MENSKMYEPVWKMWNVPNVLSCQFSEVLPVFFGGGRQMIKFSRIPEPEILGDFEGDSQLLNHHIATKL